MPALKHPQTYALLAGTALGFGLLMIWAGSRPAVWVGGGLISAGMIGGWLKYYQPDPASVPSSANLLVPEVFQGSIGGYEAMVPAEGLEIWQQAVQVAVEAQGAATAISERHPDLVSELLQILYGIIATLEQMARSAQALEQVETPTYRELAQQRIQSHWRVLKDIQNQLQTLRDQAVLADLDPGMSGYGVSLPFQLRELISDQQKQLNDAQF